MFVDEARVFVASGKGGDGAVNFHREKYKPKGGPDGGDGGRGGSVIFQADAGVDSLGPLKNHPHQKAKFGGNGQRNNRHGADAPDHVVPVPPGTVITDENGAVLADLASIGDTVIVAQGGRGGRGNASFRSTHRRAPGFAELGEPGREVWLNLEIRLIADAAVIGFPNAGKSTLVAAVSAAKPKVAAYAFTTLEPSLGVVEAGDERFTICDIPGLVEGAHEGKGLGLKFLRHVERAPVFVHMVDMTTERDPVQDYLAINNELEKFRPGLEERPALVALNKVDLAEGDVVEAAAKEFEKLGVEVARVSARDGIGVDDLVARLTAMVAEERAKRNVQGFELFRTPSDKITVKKENHAWRIESDKIQRWVAMTDMANSEAVAHLQGRMDAGGVEKALAAAGATPGDEVRISEMVFEWWPSGTYPGEAEKAELRATKQGAGKGRRGR